MKAIANLQFPLISINYRALTVVSVAEAAKSLNDALKDLVSDSDDILSSEEGHLREQKTEGQQDNHSR